MANIYDVAKQSGYSITTVSKALNNYPDISDKARRKVLEVCKELGYMPNSSARTLSTKKSFTIGVVFSEILGLGITHPFFSHVIESFKKEIEGAGYDLLFISREIGNSIYSYLEHCNHRNVDGVIVVHTNFNEPEVKEIIMSDLPCVVIDSTKEATLKVTSDNTAGAKLAIDYLVELGHKRIGHISGNTESYASNVRESEFIESMKQNGLNVPKSYIQSGGYFSLEGGYKAMQALLKLNPHPTAVFASGDYMAIGAIKAIHEAGLEVPKDISIIGFDDVEAARLVTPSLTTIRQNSIEIGKIAAVRLLERINGKNDNIHESIPVTLIERDSTSKPKDKI